MTSIHAADVALADWGFHTADSVGILQAKYIFLLLPKGKN